MWESLLLSFCRKVISNVEPFGGPGGVAGGTWKMLGEQGGVGTRRLRGFVARGLVPPLSSVLGAVALPSPPRAGPCHLCPPSPGAAPALVGTHCSSTE